MKVESFLFFTNLGVTILGSIINGGQDWNNWIYANFWKPKWNCGYDDLLCVPVCLLRIFFYKKYSAKEILVSPKKVTTHNCDYTLCIGFFINTSVLIKIESEILYPIILVRPDRGDIYNINDEVYFIWYTDGSFKEFSIHLYDEKRKILHIKYPFNLLKSKDV